MNMKIKILDVVSNVNFLIVPCFELFKQVILRFIIRYLNKNRKNTQRDIFLKKNVTKIKKKYAKYVKNILLCMQQNV